MFCMSTRLIGQGYWDLWCRGLRSRGFLRQSLGPYPHLGGQMVSASVFVSRKAGAQRLGPDSGHVPVTGVPQVQQVKHS